MQDTTGYTLAELIDGLDRLSAQLAEGDENTDAWLAASFALVTSPIHQAIDPSAIALGCSLFSGVDEADRLRALDHPDYQEWRRLLDHVDRAVRSFALSTSEDSDEHRQMGVVTRALYSTPFGEFLREDLRVLLLLAQLLDLSDPRR